MSLACPNLVKRLLAATLLALGTLGGSRASADPIELEYKGLGHGLWLSFSVNGDCRFGFAGQLNARLETCHDDAGRGRDFTTYCVDPFHYAHPGQEYKADLRSDCHLGDNGGRIAWLFDHYGQKPLDDVRAAGLQLAIWDLLLDGDDRDDKDRGDDRDVKNRGDDRDDKDRFGYDHESDAGKAADCFLKQSKGHSDPGEFLDAGANGDDHDRGQSLLGPPCVKAQETPEPATVLLLGAGLAGLAAYRRARRA